MSMKTRRKNKYLHRLTSAIAALMLSPFGCFAYDLPRDLPTFEVLCDLHKKVKKDEDEAMKRIATSYAEQTQVTKGAISFNDVRTTLDTKLNNIYSYVLLASNLSSTANSLYKLADEYQSFAANTYEYVTKKPFVAWYFVNANVAIEREIRHLVKLYGMFAASGTNLWRAAMDEKMVLLMNLKLSIEKARAILYRANVYCKIMVKGGWKPDYIWEILNSDVRKEIVEGIISRWERQ